MSNHELEKIRLKKAKTLMNLQSLPQEIVVIQTIEDFNILLEKYPKKIILIDCWAIWCAPCAAFSNTFTKLQKEYGNEFIFTKVNVDENPVIARHYGISSIPTLLFVKNGEIFHKTVGAMSYYNLKIILEKFKDYTH